MIYPATNYYLLMGCTVLRNKIQTSELSNVFLDSSALGNLENINNFYRKIINLENLRNKS